MIMSLIYSPVNASRVVFPQLSRHVTYITVSNYQSVPNYNMF
jgi:hypothetical protein